MLLKLAQVFIKTVNVYFRDFITASSWEKGVDRHLNPVHPWCLGLIVEISDRPSDR